MIFVLVGLPGAGKTEWAKKKQEETGAVIISRDDIRRCVYGIEFDIDNEGGVNLMFWALYRAALQAEIDIIVDCTNLVRHVRKRLVNLAAVRGHESTAVVFDVDPEEAWKRKKAMGTSMSREAFDRLAATYELVSPSEGFDEIVFVGGER